MTEGREQIGCLPDLESYSATAHCPSVPTMDSLIDIFLSRDHEPFGGKSCRFLRGKAKSKCLVKLQPSRNPDSAGFTPSQLSASHAVCAVRNNNVEVNHAFGF